MASGEMSEAKFIAFLKAAFENLIARSVDGSIHFVCMDWRHCFEVLSAARDVYAELKNLCVWNKDNGGMGSFYRSKHELVFVFKNGTGPHINNVELGRYGRNRTNVWDYPGVNSLHQERLEELAMHPTVKPVAPCGRCDPGLFEASRDCAGLLRRKRHSPHSRGEDWSAWVFDGTRPSLRRRHNKAVSKSLRDRRYPCLDRTNLLGD